MTTLHPGDGPYIFLIGARAAGKSACGAALAAALNLPFFDTDNLVREASGLSVAEIVAREGWPGFRARESVALRSLPGLAGPSRPARPGRRAVAATGGGLILAEANRAFLRAHGLVIFLDAPPETLAARLLAEPDAAARPPLATGGLSALEEVRAVLQARRALYLAAAHLSVDASRPLPAVVDELRRLC